jgi:hypothetical protein
MSAQNQGLVTDRSIIRKETGGFSIELTGEDPDMAYMPAKDLRSSWQKLWSRIIAGLTLWRHADPPGILHRPR